MTTPWITLDCDIDAHPKMAGLPSDAARYGWIRTLLEAKTQRRPGTFASAAHFRHVLGRHGRYLKEYIKARLLDEVDGQLHVHDWKRHQWAVAKGQQRETSEGHGEENSETSRGQKEDASRAVSVSVPVSVLETEKKDRARPDAAVAFYDRTGQFPGTKILTWLDDLADVHGEQRLVSKIAALPMDGRPVPDYLRAVRDELRAEDRVAERQERQDEAARLAEKRRPIAVRRDEDISEEEAKRLAAEYVAKAVRA